MGEYWLRCVHLYFTLLIFSVLVIIKKYIYGSSYLNMKDFHNVFVPFYRVWISLYHRAFDKFMGEYYLRSAHFYFLVVIFSVLVIIKE